jgi:hypothetical protein
MRTLRFRGLLRVEFSYRLPERELPCFPAHSLGKHAPDVAALLPKRTMQSPGISGKRGTQTVEPNEISILEKTLNQ